MAFMNIFDKPFRLTQIQLIFLVAAFLVLFDNFTYFGKLLATYPPEGENLFYLATAPVLMWIVYASAMLLVSSRWTTKPFAIFLLIVSSLVAYFTDTYQIVVDRGMIQNVIETNINEAFGLLNWKLVAYLLFLGILPSLFVWWVPIRYRPFWREISAKLKTFLVLGLVTLLLAWTPGGFYASLFREHRPLRNYTNPYYWVRNTIGYVKRAVRRSAADIKRQPIGIGSRAHREEGEKPRLVIFAVGEATRADHFGLNGYERQTTPLLSKRDNLVNFPEFISCATFTAKSVPCMFSRYGRSEFSRRKELGTENVMDLLGHTGDIDLLWRDNNSDPKKVMDRLGYEDFLSSEKNPVCENGECRDEGMLAGLERFFENNTSRDKLVVLHLMGNHGPEYYKRYPKSFEKYKPVCRSNLLEKCSQEEISNAYDNIIGYTDHVLDKAISLLEKYQDRYQVALLYIADHGESLGENGIYLHGLPYVLAPEAQKHVAAFLWVGKGFKDLNVTALKKRAGEEYSHDYIFSTLLGIYDVNSTLYDPELDLLKVRRR
jgi:lipid A ethanolaminephosphotransferase